MMCHYCKTPIKGLAVLMPQPKPNQFHPECAKAYLNETNREQYQQVMRKVEQIEKLGPSITEEELSEIIQNDWRTKK